jgi:PAS domain S-box-containing protein
MLVSQRSRNNTVAEQETRSGQADALRKGAEEAVRGNGAQSPEGLEALSPEATRLMLHELRVHQIELEMQNEELRQAQVELEAVRARYFDLYDLAPVGYCTISEKGLILEANLTAATLLGVARGALVKQPISGFILPEDQGIYYRHRQQLFETYSTNLGSAGEPQVLELRMLRQNGAPFWARLEAIAVQDPSTDSTGSPQASSLRPSSLRLRSGQAVQAEQVVGGAPVCRIVISDITEHKQAEQTLRFSYQKMDLAQRAANAGFWDWDFSTEKLTWSAKMYELFGLAATEEISYEKWLSVVHEEDREPAIAVIDRSINERIPHKNEYRIIHPDGQERWINSLGNTFYDAAGRPQHLCGICLDITERKQLQALLQTQRDLALALGSTSSLSEALNQLLLATLRINGIDSGGVYVVDAATGGFRLISHVGLTSWFTVQVSYFAPESPQARFVMQGLPTYWPTIRGVLGLGELLEREGLTSLAVIPVRYNGQVIASLNLASHKESELSENTRHTVEAIAARIGGIVSRISAEETLKGERENLAETNAALRVLLRQRGEDRKELEEALLINVKNSVAPYVDKLMKTRLTPDQLVLLENIESHLTEITSPLLRKLANQFLVLTPMEIRVAGFIRDGKTTKEIAQILHASEKSVLFHRQNIRGKLGLKRKKVNLRSHLVSST